MSALKGGTKIESIDNIELIRYNVESREGVKFKDNFLDLVLMTNLLFEIDDKKRVIGEAKRILKNNGRILIIDWKKQTSLGPKAITPIEEVKKIAEGLGLKLEKEFVDKCGERTYVYSTGYAP